MALAALPTARAAACGFFEWLEVSHLRREPLLETDVDLDRIAPLPESKWCLDRLKFRTFKPKVLGLSAHLAKELLAVK